MTFPPDRFKPRPRPSAEELAHRKAQRELDLKLLREAKAQLEAQMRRHGIPVRSDAKPAIDCHHGVTWTECQACSRRVK